MNETISLQLLVMSFSMEQEEYLKCYNSMLIQANPDTEFERGTVHEYRNCGLHDIQYFANVKIQSRLPGYILRMSGLILLPYVIYPQ